MHASFTMYCRSLYGITRPGRFFWEKPEYRSISSNLPDLGGFFPRISSVRMSDGQWAGRKWNILYIFSYPCHATHKYISLNECHSKNLPGSPMSEALVWPIIFY